MLSDDELPPLPTPEFLLKWVDGSEYRVTRPNVGDTDVFTADQMREYARAVERAAYERAAHECDPHEDDDRIDRQIKREIAERIRALGRQHD